MFYLYRQTKDKTVELVHGEPAKFEAISNIAGQYAALFTIRRKAFFVHKDSDLSGKGMIEIKKIIPVYPNSFEEGVKTVRKTFGFAQSYYC